MYSISIHVFVEHSMYYTVDSQLGIIFSHEFARKWRNLSCEIKIMLITTDMGVYYTCTCTTSSVFVNFNCHGYR